MSESWPCLICSGNLGDAKQTCSRCVARVRSQLTDLERLYALLPGAMISRAGASTWMGSGSGGMDTAMVGGDAMVLYGPGSDGANQAREIARSLDWEHAAPHAEDEWPGDPASTVAVLESWERDWRKTLALRAAADPATVTGCGLFLQRNLDVMAQNTESAFDEFAEDMRRLVGQLRSATSDGEAIDRGKRVACDKCGEPLIRRYMNPSKCEHAGQHCDHSHPNPVMWPCRGSNTCACDQGGRTDDWVCSSRSCETVVDDASYWLKVAERHEQRRRQAALTCDNGQREAC